MRQFENIGKGNYKWGIHLTNQFTSTNRTESTYLRSLGFTQVEDYYYDSSRHSVVMKKDNTCVIVDYDLCVNNNDAVFDYSK